MVSHYYELASRYNELVARYYELVSRYYELVSRYNELVSRYFEDIFFLNVLIGFRKLTYVRVFVNISYDDVLCDSRTVNLEMVLKFCSFSKVSLECF